MRPFPSQSLVRILTPLLLVLLLAGCTSIAEKVADHMAIKSLQHQHDMVLFEGDLAVYQSCLHTRGGTCTPNPAVTALAHSINADGTSATQDTQIPPARAALHATVQSSVAALPDGHPASQAADTLSHPLLQHAVDLHNHLRGHGSGSLKTEKSAGDACGKVHMPISVSSATELSGKIHRTTAAGGWKALQQHTEDLIEQKTPGTAEHKAAITEARKAQFLRTYAEAYFDDGRFIGIDFTIDAAKAQQDIANDLREHSLRTCQVYNAQAALASGSALSTGSSSTPCAALAATLYAAAADSSGNVDRQILKVKGSGFVSRDGSFTAQIPPVSIDIDPTAHHLLSVSGPHGTVDFTKIGSDLVRVVLEAIFDHHEALPVLSTSTAAKLRPALPTMPIGNVGASDLTAMTQINSRASSAVGVLADRLVQGIGPLSLNNDALEQLITTLITTSVHKAIEKATWCWYACNLDRASDKLHDDAKAALKAGEEDLVHRLKDDAYKGAEKTCLALHVRE